MDKNKGLVAFTAADKNNLGYAFKLVASFKYFHPDVDIVLFTDEKNPDNLPKNCIVKDISGHMEREGKNLFYKQKPYFANWLMNEGYTEVLGLDSDQIILGNIDYILHNEKKFDVGGVLNFNPFDLRAYGPITIQPVHYATEYLNCGLVMMRSHKFVKHWLKLCNGPFFNRVQYREQDLFNIMCYFGEYDVFNFDDYNTYKNYAAWHGLLGSSETLNTVLKGKDIIIPKNDVTGYPSVDIMFKVWHAAGGQAAFDKLNYRVKFPPEVVERINEILE